MDTRETLRNAVFFGAVLGAGLLAKRGLEKGWEKRTARPAPKNPAAPEVSWVEALTFAAIAGVAVGVTRTVVRRVLSERLDGHRTPTGRSQS